MSTLRPVSRSRSDDPNTRWQVFEDEDGNRWILKLHLRNIGDKVEVAGMDMHSLAISDEPIRRKLEDKQPARLTSELWRAAFARKEPLRKAHAAELFAQSVGSRDVSGLDDDVDSEAAASHELVARIYNRARELDAIPSLAVAKRLGISKAAAVQRIYRARAAGALPPAKRGRPPKSARE